MFRVALWVSGEFWEVLCVLVFGGLRCAGMRFFRKLFVLGLGVELVGALCFGLCYGGGFGNCFVFWVVLWVWGRFWEVLCVLVFGRVDLLGG